MGSVQASPGSQDLSPGAAKGVLLLVDYADRWPTSHLTWLMANALLHGTVPARVLLLARSPHPWPALRATLADHQAHTSDQLLGPPTRTEAERARLYRIACDCFAARYGVADPEAVPSPVWLNDPGLELTLTLHMAALVAVDAHVRGTRQPDDPADLSAYLLDRERRHWRALYENHTEGLAFHTPPDQMTRMVFTAALAVRPTRHSGADHVWRHSVAGDLLRPPRWCRAAQRRAVRGVDRGAGLADRLQAAVTQEGGIPARSRSSPSPLGATSKGWKSSRWAPSFDHAYESTL